MSGAMGRPRWTRDELAAASPEVVEASRWELYATRLWAHGRAPGSAAEALAELEAPDIRTEAQRNQARRRGLYGLHALRNALLPPDEGTEAAEDLEPAEMTA